MIHYNMEVRKTKQVLKAKNLIKKLNVLFAKSDEKVAYYYENVETGAIFSFNENLTFYAASTIKILPILYIYDTKKDIETKLLVQEKEKKQGSGILKNESLPKEYSVKELMEYSLVYSDNTAYLKLVEWIGKENLIQYGKSLGAQHSLEGKDSFGIINCSDLAIYFKKIHEIIIQHQELIAWLKNPVYQIIQDKSLYYASFLRKYGAFDVAYHECGIVEDENPYYLFILTQKGENKKAKRFINKTARQIAKIHKVLNEK